MNELQNISAPPQIEKIAEKARETGFRFNSKSATGMLLRSLAASKPGGRLLEIGTGLGHGTSWLLSGMDGDAHLYSVENSMEQAEFARELFKMDTRVDIVSGSAHATITNYGPRSFDLIFADAPMGKFEMLEETISALRPGGIYVADDMNPQPTWPENGAEKVAEMLETLERQSDLCVTKMNWDTGIVMAVRKSPTLPRPPQYPQDEIPQLQKPVTRRITRLLGWE